MLPVCQAVSRASLSQGDVFSIKNVTTLRFKSQAWDSWVGMWDHPDHQHFSVPEKGECIHLPKVPGIYTFLNSQNTKCEIRSIDLHIESLGIINDIIDHLRFDGAKLLHGCRTAIVLNPLQDQAHDVDAKIKIKTKLHLAQFCKSGKTFKQTIKMDQDRL